jgi:hypothetical protein
MVRDPGGRISLMIWTIGSSYPVGDGTEKRVSASFITEDSSAFRVATETATRKHRTIETIGLHI